MRQPKNSALIKATARERLLGQYGTLIGATILYKVIELFVNNFISLAVMPESIITLIIFFVLAFLVSLLLSIFESGFAYLYMNVIYAQPVSVNDIFHGFRHHPDKALLIKLPFAICSIAVSGLLMGIRYLELHKMTQSPLFIGIVAAFTVVVLIYFFMYLNFSQAYYILQDFPDKSPIDILKMSAMIMKGNKFKFFLLILSFIPLYLFGIIALFVPLLWISVYMSASFAAFYQDRVALFHQNKERVNTNGLN